MANKSSVISDRSSGHSDQAAVPLRECRAWVATVAGERQWGDTRQSWFHRAADRTHLPYRTIRALYYGEIADRDHPSMLMLKDAAESHEIDDLASRFEQLVARLRERRAARR